MTLHEIDSIVLERMPAVSRLPGLTDHENAETYRMVSKAMRDFKAGKPPAMRVAVRDIPKILEDLRAQLKEQEPSEELEQK